ncbi:MAG: flagellar hook-associated protein FlgK [Intestinimonas sp.]|nr:flagellar hook-associated protein FlgK [Intestinimonas sp.]
MSSITTFGAFTTARLGIYAAQKGLDVTGHNISNINTEGYTRQVLDQISLRTNGADRYTSAYNFPIGSGVLTTGVSQIRDPYLDIRYRTEEASVGATGTKLDGLTQLSGILDEVGDGSDEDGVLEAQFNDLISQLETMSNGHATEDEYDTLVCSSADSLVKLFNYYANRLDTIKENQETSLNQDISDVNDILTNIQTLNDSIMKSEIHGDNALELKDQRNELIDKLSNYTQIDVTYESVSIGAGTSVDKLVIKTAGDNARTLVDGDYVTQFSIQNVPAENPNYDPSDPSSLPYLTAGGTPTGDSGLAEQVPSDNYDLQLSALTNENGATLSGSTEVKLSDTELYGSLQSSRELLTEKGEFSSSTAVANDPDATTKRGIPYYQDALNGLAKKFASVLNEANTGYLQDTSGNYVKSDGTVLINASDVASTGLTTAQISVLDTDGVKLGGVLFSNSSDGDDTTDITASNLSISNSWSTGSVQIQNSMIQNASSPGSVGSSDSSNIEHIITLIQGSQTYLPSEVETDAASGSQKYFEGSFQQMFTDIQEKLAKDVKSTTTLQDNYSAAATELETSRESTSGVDLNDEAMSLMQYQKSYSAACRLMTTLDDALDKLINDTGMVGR